MANTVSILIDKCVHCGACTAVCDNNALTIKKPDWTLKYNKDKCTKCLKCIAACPAQVIKEN